MALDASIAMGYKPIQLESPVNQFANILQIQQAQSQNKLAGLTLQKNERDQQEAATLNQLYAGAVNPDGTIDRTKLFQGLATSNLGTKIPAIKKAFLEEDEATDKSNKARVELFDMSMKGRRDALAGVTTPEQYLQWHEGNHSDPILGPMLASRGVKPGDARAQVEAAMQTPGGLQQLITQSALGMTKFAELNKPSIHTVNSGKVTTMYATPGMGGAPTAINTTQMTTTPDADQRDATTKAEGAAGRAVTLNGQRLADARAREQLAQGKVPAGYRLAADGKGLEAIPGGPADPSAQHGNASEGERKAATLLQRLQFSQQQLAKAREDSPNAATPNALANGLEWMGMDALANGVTSEARQRIEGAQLDMLDAALTLGTGAAYTREQLKGYAKSYFPQLNDDPKTIEEKNQRLLNVIEAAKTSAGRAAPKASAAAPAPAQVPPTNAKGWKLHVDGKGNRAYVGPNNEVEEVR
jgi:hypothetical protein